MVMAVMAGLFVKRPKIVIATGSEASSLPGVVVDEKTVVTSTGALTLPAVPKTMVVIGAGAAGLVSAYIAATVKAKVTLVESHKMGGDCLNYGCVPSKALIKTATLARQMRDSADYGIAAAEYKLDFDSKKMWKDRPDAAPPGRL